MYTDGKYDYYSDGYYRDDQYYDDDYFRYYREDSGAFDSADYDYDKVNDKGVPQKRNVKR